METLKSQLIKICEIFKPSLLKALTHFIYLVLLICFINLVSTTFYAISIPAIIKDIINKELGKDSYLSKKIDYELYAISPYTGFDIDKMRNETNGYVNYYKSGYTRIDFNEINKVINKKYVQTYREFLIDLDKFHYELLFNKFNYDI